MRNKSIIKAAMQERFGFKVFIAVIFVIIFVLTIYTVIGAVHEGNKAKEKLRDQGEMLVDLLSQSSLVGIFAEDTDMLKNATAGILELKDVRTVRVYNADEKLLYIGGSLLSPGKTSPKLSDDEPGDLKDASRLTVVETANSFHFIKPVATKPRPEFDESIYVNSTGPADTMRVIGYVRIELGKDSYRKEIISLVKRNAVMMLVFIVTSGVIIFLAVNKVTQPIQELTNKVKALERGLSVEPVSVESRGEIGKLESAFNAMVEARVKAEKSMRESEERERHLIATDLHDFVGQNLVAMQYQLKALRKIISSPDATASLDATRELITQTIQYTRSLTIELRSPALEELGLEAAIESLAESYESTHGVPVRVEDDGLKKEISEETGYLLFRSVRELLWNIVKHAKATEARVQVTRTGDNICIVVRDNGIGFIATATPKLGHCFGLFTIRERLNGLGGRCDIESNPGEGTTVILTAPLVKAAEHEKETS